MERKKFKFELFLGQYFGNFFRILLANLMFAIPSVALLAAFIWLSVVLFHSVNILFVLLSCLLIFPFYSGVVMVTRNIIREDKSESVPKLFIRGVRENFLTFLIHGVFLTVVIEISYLSLSYYIGSLGKSWVFFAMLFFSALVVLFLLFTMYYLPLMTVTYELKKRYLYKNSLLMSYGEFKNNIFATLMLIIFASIFASFVMILNRWIPLIYLFAALWALFLPATFAHITGFYVNDGMIAIMTAKASYSSDEDKGEMKDAESPKRDASLTAADLAEVDISTLKDTDDYIFFNGRMMKQSVLLKLAKEAQENGREDLTDHG